MSTTLTPQQALQQIVAALREAERQILPAKLVNPAAQGPNGHALAGYLTKNNLQPTAENFLRAIKDLFETLEWVVKPQKLLLKEQNERPAVKKSAIASEADFAAVKKAGEAADAKKLADEASLKQCRELIQGYNPTRGNNRYDAREREDMQKHWSEKLNQAIANKENLQTFAKALAAAIENRYRTREAATERL